MMAAQCVNLCFFARESIHIHVLVTSPCGLLSRLPPFQTLVYPLAHGRITALLELLPHHALEYLSREANKVVSPQSILKLPVATLAFFSRQQLLVAEVARPDSQITAHCQKVEAYLGGFVTSYPLLQVFDDLGGE